MKTQYTVALAIIAGFGLGAVAIESLHAQSKPSVYNIVEIDVTNPDPDIPVPALIVCAGNFHWTFFRNKKLFCTGVCCFIVAVIDIPVNLPNVITAMTN